MGLHEKVKSGEWTVEKVRAWLRSENASEHSDVWGWLSRRKQS